MTAAVKAMIAVVAVLSVVLAGLVVALVVQRTGGDDEPDRQSRRGPSSSESSGPSQSSPSESPSDPDARKPPSAELARFYEQQLTWTSCGSNECSTLEVPVDYGDPTGDTVALALERAPARDEGQRIGSLVVNPGGPGAPGTDMATNADGYFRPQLLEKLDIVAFDPRGTGDSNPVDCLSDQELDAYIAQDPTPDSAAEGREYTEEQDAFFQGCVDNSDDLVGHVSTVEAARDMDVLRAALDESTLRYLGFSYGTTLGATYAELFPAEVGPFVLDGAIDQTLDFRQNAISQAAGFERALRSYVQSCLDDGGCFLGDSMPEALGTITDLLDEIEQEPLPTDQERDLQIGNAFYGLVLPLYSESNWPALDQGLQEALDGDGSTMLLLSDSYGGREPGGGYSDNSLEAIYAINCLDDPAFVEPNQVPAEIPAFEKASPTFGEVFAWGLIGCHGLQVEPAEPPPTIDANGAAPILVVGTTRDPATPYEEAVALADQLESGVLLTRDGDGHTAYNRGNTCIDEAIEGLLLDGTVPEDGTTC
jgi:pimeloyl-ACP methyl ester carboxylesterase